MIGYEWLSTYLEALSVGACSFTKGEMFIQGPCRPVFKYQVTLVGVRRSIYPLTPKGLTLS